MARRGYQYIRVCPVTLSACCAGSVQSAATPQLRSVAEILGRGDEIAGGVHQLGAAGAHDMGFGQVCGGRGFGAGLGLGLPICRRIAQGHGGMIVAQSEEGKGSLFTVSLPAVRSGRVRLNDSGSDYAGGFNATLVELSDALKPEAFLQRYLD